ncbi:MAG TPA: hypothetical protein DEP91_08555 [Sphingomonas bacterium]|uniref:Uncharacterized protein n=1 Tax=Sphingomonas bacterium TaxID=1895847 RepID=A0A3D0WBU2_9SPHN|nr:hypothetical protein [Sphingomonas bacterium]
MLRRIVRACYRDWQSTDEAKAHHMAVRLFEQLTGRYDAEAAMRAVFWREMDGNTAQATEIGVGAEDQRRLRWDFDRDR